MTKEIQTIYNNLLKSVTEKKLKEISIDIISTYKARDMNSLLVYADILGFDASGMDISRLFARIIQNYHPDKATLITGRIEDSFKENRISDLLRFKQIYMFKKPVKKTTSNKYDINFEETYSYNDEFSGQTEGYSQRDFRNDEFEFEEEITDGIDPHEYGFIEAVNSLFFGGIDDSITADDLNNIEGELDLSDSEIIELNGIEHCRNITVLNLSGNNIYKIDLLSRLELIELLYISDNNIESIECLSGLVNLKELDISFNSIEDISVLLQLKELVYVNLLENPVKNGSVVNELEERGVIVIF